MNSFIARFKEPSSWAGIAILANIVAHAFGVSGDLGSAIVQVGSGIAGAAAVLMAEKNKH